MTEPTLDRIADPRSAGTPNELSPENARRLLTSQRTEVCDRIAALEREYQAVVEANALVATDDEHDPEGASTAFERAHVAALLSQCRQELEDVEAALTRLTDGAYGSCEVCKRPIPAGRLEIRPAATQCVACAGAAPRR